MSNCKISSLKATSGEQTSPLIKSLHLVADEKERLGRAVSCWPHHQHHQILCFSAIFCLASSRPPVSSSPRLWLKHSRKGNVARWRWLAPPPTPCCLTKPSMEGTFLTNASMAASTLSLEQTGQSFAFKEVKALIDCQIRGRFIQTSSQSCFMKIQGKGFQWRTTNPQHSQSISAEFGIKMCWQVLCRLSANLHHQVS